MEETQALIDSIQKLKKEKKAIVLAHNYMRPEIFEVADAIGDSYELSIAAQKMQSEVIVFAGVHFMAESAKLLNPEKKVLLPSLAAGCFMADTITVAGLQKMKEKHPGVPVVVYMNTSAAVKALSDSTCTSSNALKIVESFSDNDRVIFAPDRHLADYIAEKTEKQILPWAGFCHVHTRLTPELVQRAKAKFSTAHVLLHPETPKRMFPYADHICGTGGMAKYIELHPEVQSFLIGTEEGMVGRLRREFPEREFYPLMGTCINMKQITLENIHSALDEEKYEISVDEKIFDAARKSLEQMVIRTER